MSDQDPATTRRRRRVLGAVFGFAVGVLAVLIVGTAVTSMVTLTAIRSTQVTNAQRSQDTLDAATAAKRASDRIEDCTTPGRACFKQSQKRSAGIVKLVNDAQRQASIYAASCADRPGSQSADEIEACVRAAFAAAPQNGG